MPATESFRDAMERTLYSPGGYYRTRDPRRDYYTAADLHPAFGEILAQDIADRLDRLAAGEHRPPYSIVEMGSGSGALARQILTALGRLRPHWAAKARYVLVERSRERLLESVARLPSGRFPILGLETLEALEPCAGIFLSNELVDAFPVHVLEKNGGRLWELALDSEGRSTLIEIADDRLSAQAARSRSLPEGSRRAVCLEAGAWLETVSSRLKAGAIITIDYGSRYAPDAPTAPVAFRRHALVADPIPSRDCDVTAPVDFGVLIEEGLRLGLKTESYGSLGRFLLDRGIMEWVERSEPLRERPRLKTLFHPEGMGEAFKVLVQTR